MNETTPRTSNVREKAADLAGSAKEQAKNIAGKAMDKAEEQFNTQRQSVVGEIQNFAAVMRDAGDRLRERNASPIGAMVVNTIADRLDTFGRSFQGKDLDAVFGDIENFAHRNTAAFLGTAAALGFLASRFMKSSRKTTTFSEPWRSQPFGSATTGTGSPYGSGSEGL